MEKLKDFIKTYPGGAAALAAAAGISAPYLSQIKNGKRAVSVPAAVKLVAATEGKITIGDLIPELAGMTK